MVSTPRTWNLERVLDAIRALHQRGIALNYGSVLKVDPGLTQAAMKRLGSWNNALRAAGYDPDKIRLTRRPWTRSEIIALIQNRAAAGLPIASYNVVPMSAEVASRRLFGSWNAALRAAGVASPVKQWPVWSKVSVVEAILLRREAAEPLYSFAVAAEDSRLYAAAQRYFGSWDEALRAAGFDPATIRRHRPQWTPDSVLDELRLRANTGTLANKPAVDPISLARASRKFYGSWDAALRAAGVAGAVNANHSVNVRQAHARRTTCSRTSQVEGARKRRLRRG